MSGYSVKLPIWSLSIIPNKDLGGYFGEWIAMAETERPGKNKNLCNCDASRSRWLITFPSVSLVCFCTVHFFLNMGLYVNCYGISSYLYPSCSDHFKSCCKMFSPLFCFFQSLKQKSQCIFSNIKANKESHEALQERACRSYYCLFQFIFYFD